MRVKDIYKYLDSLYPITDACDFDNVGLLVGNPEAEVKGALVTLDLTEEALNNAIRENCQLIITHHPVIFTPLKSVLSDSLVYDAIRNNISIISMHTNLDMGDGGVNDCLCKAIGLSEVEIFTAEDGFKIRSGTVPSCTAEELGKSLKSSLNTKVKYADGRRKITKVLVCSGGGGDFLEDAINNGFDALITADVKHNRFIQASKCGVSIFDCGHFETENIVIKPLAERLSEQFPQINFIPNLKGVISYI